MLASAETAEMVADTLWHHKVSKVVLDPVILDFLIPTPNPCISIISYNDFLGRLWYLLVAQSCSLLKP